MTFRFPNRTILSGLAVCWITTLGFPVAFADAPNFETDVLPFFKTHCIRCHGPSQQDSEFRIDTLSRDVGGGPSVRHWGEVIEKINNDEMPPADEPNRPTAEESARVVEWLSARIKEGEAARLARREPVSLHRLTRDEYANTVEDLLGVRYDVADPGGLNEEPDWHGFERIGSVLSLSPSHVEKYFAAAETILNEAYPPKDPTSYQFTGRIHAGEMRGGAARERRKELEAAGLWEKVRIDMWPGHRVRTKPASPKNGRLDVGGIYKVRVQLSGLKPANGRPPHLTVYAPELDRVLFSQDIIAPEDAPTIVEFTTHLPPDYIKLELMNDVPGPSVLPRSGRSGRKIFFSLEDGRIPWQLKLTDEEGEPLYPFLILDWMEWKGPLLPEDVLERRAFYMPPDDASDDEIHKRLHRFLERAFRRPVSDIEVEPYLSLIQQERTAGADLRSAVKTAMLAALCSKNFLYLAEGAPDRTDGLLTDWELASRLSYFLWSTMPDDELFALAREGKLSDPSVLKAQVKRMLTDPKAERFTRDFPRAWLQLKQVGMFTPDSKLYPEYDDYLERSMIRETTEFFGEVLEQNLSLREFLVSDWTMVNTRLAHHYGIDGIERDEWQRVTLKPEHHRGGILTQASVLSLTSDGQRHRPVHRGVWVSESIFGKSPPPPPANVEPIEPTPVDSPKATLRMKLDAHKSNASCAACHRKIDPLGLAFEHFDAIGRYRTVESVATGTGAAPPVDASGILPDGRSFTDHTEFRQLLLDDLDAFNATFVKKLATFALRRTMTIDDRDDLAVIATASKDRDYRLRDIVEAMVLADLFRKR